MDALRAKVRNGRLVLDEPTTLPEGTEVELEVVSGLDDMTEAERAELERALDESQEEYLRGDVVDASVVLAELRARREGRADGPGPGRGPKSE